MSSIMSEAWRKDREASGRALEACRGYLLLVAEKRLAPGVKPKEGTSDVVQETLLEAQRVFGRFRGTCEAELLAWLRQILLHKLAHAARRYRTIAKRRVGREVALDGGTDSLCRDETSPGGRAVRREEEAAMVAALDKLPEPMRLAVQWRHHEGCSFDEIGRRLGRSNVSARKLWLRGLEELRRELIAAGQEP
jgi:RNA polymerase sigma-70 factor (ECF subfamily)